MEKPLIKQISAEHDALFTSSPRKSAGLSWSLSGQILTKSIEKKMCGNEVENCSSNQDIYQQNEESEEDKVGNMISYEIDTESDTDSEMDSVLHQSNFENVNEKNQKNKNFVTNSFQNEKKTSEESEKILKEIKENKNESYEKELDLNEKTDNIQNESQELLLGCIIKNNYEDNFEDNIERDLNTNKDKEIVQKNISEFSSISKPFFLPDPSEQKKILLQRVDTKELVQSLTNKFQPLPDKLSGYLMKRGAIRKSWKKRWFYVRKNRLYYSEDQKSDYINFIGIEHDSKVLPDVLRPDSSSYGFHIQTPDRKYYLAATTTQERDHWIKIVSKIIQKCKEESPFLSTSSSSSSSSSSFSSTTTGSQEKIKRVYESNKKGGGPEKSSNDINNTHDHFHHHGGENFGPPCPPPWKSKPLLDLILIEASNLLHEESYYCVLTCANIPPCRTRIIKGDLPIWNEDYTFLIGKTGSLGTTAGGIGGGVTNVGVGSALGGDEGGNMDETKDENQCMKETKELKIQIFMVGKIQDKLIATFIIPFSHTTDICEDWYTPIPSPPSISINNSSLSASSTSPQSPLNSSSTDSTPISSPRSLITNSRMMDCQQQQQGGGEEEVLLDNQKSSDIIRNNGSILIPTHTLTPPSASPPIQVNRIQSVSPSSISPHYISSPLPSTSLETDDVSESVSTMTEVEDTLSPLNKPETSLSPRNLPKTSNLKSVSSLSPSICRNSTPKMKQRQISLGTSRHSVAGFPSRQHVIPEGTATVSARYDRATTMGLFPVRRESRTSTFSLFRSPQYYAIFHPTIELHLALHYSPSSDKEDTSLLEPYGIPTSVIPRRLDTGDILLFSCADVRTWVTKLLTRSAWDHCAMVVRKQDNVLVILESTIEGVHTYNLERHLECYRLCSTIGVRRLNIIRSRDLYQNLYTFIEQVRGRPYKRNFLELVLAATKNTSGGNSSSDLTSIFCSELTAAAYQRMECLPRENNSNNYLPKDFSAPHFPLLNGKLENVRIFGQLSENELKSLKK